MHWMFILIALVTSSLITNNSVLRAVIQLARVLKDNICLKFRVFLIKNFIKTTKSV